jgi:hypothetical protein|tara:strand:+ start:1565 stop:1726 length:162 start_codon:yes stop_codon:yes gene_type:complete
MKYVTIIQQNEEIMQKIEQAERYVNSLHGNTSFVKMKKYAINKKINKLKAQLV